MRKKITVGVVILVVIGFIAALRYLYLKNEEPFVVFQTKSPEMKEIIKKTVATGSVVPKKEVTIKPNISGIIQELYTEPGDTISIGDLIAKVRVVPNISSLSTAKNRKKEALANLKNQEKNYRRQKVLYEGRALSDKDFDAAILAYKQAKIAYESAKENYDIIKTGASSTLGTSSNTLIRSTASGMMLEIPVEIGNQVIEANNFNEGTTIAILADVNKMIFKGKIDESEIGKIKEGMALKITIGALLGKEFNAILDYIAPKGKTENNAVQFEIRGTLNNPDMFIRSGLSANASVVLESTDGEVLAINEALIQYDENQNPFVEIQTGEQTFEKQEIVLGVSDGLYAEVKEGVSKDDKIKVWAVTQK